MALNYEIENCLFQIIGGSHNTDDDCLLWALTCYDFLFSANTEFRQTFEKMDGLTQLENL